MTTKERLLKQFQDSEVTEVSGTLVVHLDKPSGKEKARREEVVRKGGPSDDDCPLCKALRKSRYAVVVYDTDAVLCFGEDKQGGFASGFPRRKEAA